MDMRKPKIDNMLETTKDDKKRGYHPLLCACVTSPRVSIPTNATLQVVQS
jgi:hypothetical protein